MILKLTTVSTLLFTQNLALAATPQFFSPPQPAPAATTSSTALSANAVAISATPISTSKDWRVVDLGTECIAETVTTVAGLNHHLEIHVAKSTPFPVEVKIRSEIPTSATIGYQASLDRTTSRLYSFTKNLGNGVDETFWNIPRGTNDLIAYLKREIKFEVQAFDAAGKSGSAIAFSLRGSTAALLDLGKKCASGLTLPTVIDSSFEKAFLIPGIASSVATVDLQRINPGKADALRTLVNEARTAFLSSKISQTEIEQLNAKYLKEINELSGLRRNLDHLTQTEVTRLEAARAQALAASAKADQEIAQLKPQIAATEAHLVQANLDYEAAYSQIKAVLPEYNRLIAMIHSNESNLADAQNRLMTIDSRTNNANIELARLQSEGRDVRFQFTNLQNQIQTARNEYSRATLDRNAFDAPSELRRRLQADTRIVSIGHEIQNFEQRIRQQEQAALQQEQERNRLNNEVVNCRKIPGRDCSPEQSRLIDAQRRFQELRQGIQQLEAAKSRKQDEIAQVRRQIQNEVSQIESDLDRRVMVSRNRIVDIESDMRRLENRLRTIEQIEIPNRQNEIARLANDRSQATRDISDSDRSLRRARTDLANFRQTTGFDNLQAQVDKTLTTVNNDKAELLQIDREIKKQEKVVSSSQATLKKVASDMANVLKQIQAKEARSIDVMKLLEPYELAKTDIEARKTASDLAFATAQAEFSALL